MNFAFLLIRTCDIKPIKQEWERVFTEAFYSESYQTFCEKYGLEKSFLSSADFYTFLEEDMENVSEVIRALELST